MAPLGPVVVHVLASLVVMCSCSPTPEPATPESESAPTPEATHEPSPSPAPEDAISTPRLIVQYVEGKGYNISIPNAGQEMQEFKYYVTVNEELGSAKSVAHSGRVECFNDKSRFRLARDRDFKEGDSLSFYLIGFRKPDGFQMERVYELKKDDKGVLEFQEKSKKVGLQKDGIWYPGLDKLKEINP